MVVVPLKFGKVCTKNRGDCSIGKKLLFEKGCLDNLPRLEKKAKLRTMLYYKGNPILLLLYA